MAKLLTGKNLVRKASPVEYALAKRSLGDCFLGLRVMVLLADDKTKQDEMLGSLAYLISMGAMVVMRTPTDREENRAGLCDCLEAIRVMSVNGNIWDAEWAYSMALAVEVAMEYFCDYRPLAVSFEPSCKDFSNAIRNNELSKLEDSLKEAKKKLGMS